jgi:hypothetical protein
MPHVEANMALSKRTTIRLSPTLHRCLAQLAAQWRTSIEDLVRMACERQYGLVAADDRLAAAQALACFRLPVSDVAAMKREIVPSPGRMPG